MGKKRQRRSAGEGTIRQRKDGRWEARLDLGLINGKRRYKALYGATRKEAAEKLAEAQRQREQGVDVTQGRTTVAAFLDVWLEQVVRVRNRPRPKSRGAR